MFEFIKFLTVLSSEDQINTGLNGEIGDLILVIVTYAIDLAGLIAIAFIIYGGYQYITSGGNDEGSKKAVHTLTYAIIGLLIVFASYAIVNTIFTNVLPF